MAIGVPCRCWSTMNPRFWRILVDQHLNLSLGPDRLNNHGSFPGRSGYVLRRFRSFPSRPNHPATAALTGWPLEAGLAPKTGCRSNLPLTGGHRLYGRGLQALIQMLFPLTGASSWCFTRNDSVPQSNSANRSSGKASGIDPRPSAKASYLQRAEKGPI
jgi:hypothetical protein